MQPPRRHLLAAAASAAALAVGAVACSEPPLPEPPVDGTDGNPAPVEPDDDPARDALVGALAELHEAVVAAEAHLRAAADATGVSGARVEAERALGRLLDGAGSRPDGAAVLPADSPERGNLGERDDLLSLTLTLARDVGGEAGTAVVALLRDELAGDLGAWERDAAGVVAGVERTADTSGDLEVLTAEILELPGEATRALAWTMAAIDADDLDAATTAASRAASHLDLAAQAIAELLDPPGPGAADVSDDA